MNLRNLSDKKLLELVTQSVVAERKATLLVLELIAEMDSRKLYLEYGYNSLFVYLTTELNYSEGATHRRITSARMLSKYPETKDMLLDARLSLTTLSMLSGKLTEENKDSLLKEASYKSKRELEDLLLSIGSGAKKKKIREKIKPVVVEKEVKDKSLLETKAEQGFENHFSRKKIAKPVVEKRLNLSFSVPEETGELIDEAKQILSGKFPKGAKLEDLFVAGLNALVKEHRAKTKSLGSKKSRGSKKGSRHIPAKVRKVVLERDKYQCSYIGENGKACCSKWDIEVDHLIPFSEGGEHTPQNLRVLCGAHHQYVTEQKFGKVWERSA